MFNFDGGIVAGVINANELGRTMNEIVARRIDERRAAGPTEQDYCNLFNAYNQLVTRFNRLIDENKKIDAVFDKTLAERDAELAERDRRIAALTAESEERRLSAYEAWGKLFDASMELDRLKIKAGELAPPELKPDTEL